MMFIARKNKGSILIVTLIFCSVLAVLSVALLKLLFSKRILSHTLSAKARAVSLAEGGLEKGTYDTLNALSNHHAPTTSGIVTINNSTVTYKAEAVGAQRTETDVYGVKTYIQSYKFSSTAEAKNTAAPDFGNVSATVNSIVDIRMTPLFQYAVFYDKDLEIQPGPSMTLAGRVHTNGSLYLGCGGTLTFNSEYLRAVGKMYRHRKDNSSTAGGNISIKEKGSDNFHNMESWFDSDYKGFDSNADGDFNDPDDIPPFQDRADQVWQGTVLSGASGITKSFFSNHDDLKAYVENDSGEFDLIGNEYINVGTGNGSYSKGYFHDKADLSIIDNRAFDKDGSDITDQLPPGTISVTSFFDGREETNVTTTDIDISLLNSSGKFPANGLLYCYRTDSNMSEPNGVRLKNGSELENKLTVVSETPVYVWGDFNTVNKKGSAVMCDAINLLSNAWNDSKTNGSLPNASATTYNFAFVTGNYETIGSSYNGGFENLPRFHENWSNKNCNLTGSFVNLWTSEYALGSWIYGSDNYTAPVRNWSYDLDFNDVNNLPPFTPMVYTAVRQAWWLGDDTPVSGPTGTVSRTDDNGFTTDIQVVDNENGTYTYTYTVTSDDNENTPALSHIVFTMPEDSLFNGPGNWDYGTDPTTGITGWKSDEVGSNLGEDGIQGSQVYTFTTDAPPDNVEIGTKAGPNAGSVTFTSDDIKKAGLP